MGAIGEEWKPFEYWYRKWGVCRIPEGLTLPNLTVAARIGRGLDWKLFRNKIDAT